MIDIRWPEKIAMAMVAFGGFAIKHRNDAGDI